MCVGRETELWNIIHTVHPRLQGKVRLYIYISEWLGDRRKRLGLQLFEKN